ncbi:hypothetical protein GOP47_0015735 [Adiantum capillus-veneris]|uniref:Rab-GAP TBC domain-containing protein n=1 Tax=Adiantum capillus-veneris TaxID=13818 RepID=A0A9D4UKV4_ADICA|nr:hypothetical protein GOP47_0015735 [Adiantum capillus-veneris]
MTFSSSKIALHIRKPSPSLAFAVTAVAGFVVAAALGGTLFFSLRKQQKRSPLTSKQWGSAFDAVSGRLIDKQKVLHKVRFGGIEPHIRAEVWPFLLGFYDLDSTQEERESERYRKRELYMGLKMRCNALRIKLFEVTQECDEGNTSTEVSYEDSNSSQGGPRVSVLASQDSSFTGNDDKEINDSCKRQSPEVDDRASVAQETNADLTEDVLSSGSSNTEDVEDEQLVKTVCESVFSGKVHSDMENDCLIATEEFINCQRIIRVDAVRMNAEWVPYSPSQANVTEQLAFQLARSVGLQDDEHLEPCRQHHAARLVAVLEAYALHDPETGYCQDEVGIRRQLNKISSIFKAGDPHLYSHLESIDAENCFFVYRMVVVLLRRELTFEQTISLWEVLWAEKKALSLSNTKQRKVRRRDFVTEDLILFVIAAAIRRRRKVIIEKCRGLDEVLRECNSMAGHLDVWKLLKDAHDLAYAVEGKL